MTQKELNIKSIMDQLIGGHMLEREAAGLAHKSLRQIQRIKQRVKIEGDQGLVHKGRAHPSNHQRDPTCYDEMIALVSSLYSDYSYVMIHEKLRDKHNMTISMPTLRNELIRRGIRVVKKQRKRDIQRTMRERKACFGEMIQYDGSYHNWFEGRGGMMEACLLVSVDDATGKVFARFDHSEGLMPTFRFWREYTTAFGKPKSIYLDHFATYKINHPNATDDTDLVTQFGRVCKELGIELIFANSPQGKGRVERMNGTLQDRLVKELRETNIFTIAEANIFLSNIFLPQFNAQFMVESRESSNLHISLREDEREKLDSLFSQQKKRKVQNDFTLRFEGRIFQLYRNKEGGSLVYHGESVIVEKHMDTSIHIRNKNGNYILSIELNELPPKLSKLPFPPVLSEDIHLMAEIATAKLEYMTHLQEDTLQKQTEQKQKRDIDNSTLSLLRQKFYKEHPRYSKFDPHWIPTLT